MVRVKVRVWVRDKSHETTTQHQAIRTVSVRARARVCVTGLRSPFGFGFGDKCYDNARPSERLALRFGFVLGLGLGYG